MMTKEPSTSLELLLDVPHWANVGGLELLLLDDQNETEV
jgi:hypothetical protein